MCQSPRLLQQLDTLDHLSETQLRETSREGECCSVDICERFDAVDCECSVDVLHFQMVVGSSEKIFSQFRGSGGYADVECS